MKRVLQFAIVFLVLFSGLVFASATPSLDNSFKNPPDSAKPHTWWHWVNGNISKQGITADLEAMAEVGIGGAQIFNVGGEIISIPEGPVKFMSPDWLDLIKHAATEADRLGIELCLHNCAGWSSSGGPWITPEYSMQVVVYNELKTTGPARFNQILPQPYTNMDYYRDIAILAFPTPENDLFRINDATLKSAGLIYVDYNSAKKYALDPNFSQVPANAAIALDSIIDLTSKTAPDGLLKWSVPDGNWTIMRFGYTTVGRKNNPAPESGLGLECDKLSKKALDLHWEKGIKPILDKLGPLSGKVLNNLLIDSYEVGANNWTPDKRSEFKKRTGYDLLNYLPTLAGRVVENALITEKFLWDFRRVNSDMFADNYFGYFAQKCKQHGLLSSIEPYHGSFECLAVGAKFDIIMGEFWVGGDSVGQDSELKLAATSAHTHGQKIVGAESFTSMPDTGSWQNHPGSLKIIGDQVYCIGVNRFILHRYAHQPWNNYLPGITMGQWGINFDRTNTWFMQSKPWMKYLARSQYMLQQGQFVADVLFFAGQSIPNGLVSSQKLKDLGYDYDVIGTDLIEKLSVKNGLITLPSGMQYKLLVMPDTAFMTAKLAEKIEKLINSGAVVLGPKPQNSPSLMDYPKGDSKLHSIADRLWGKDGDIKTINKPCGKGRIISGLTPEDVLRQLKITPDFIDLSKNARTAFIHRKIDNADVYFVASRNQQQNTALCSFRITGKKPQLWNPETGDIEPAPLWQAENNRTIVTIPFAPSGSMFVVFRQPIDNTDSYVSVESKITPEPTDSLKILKAQYGVFSSDIPALVDVTDKLAAMIKDTNLEVHVNNDLAGTDPAPGTYKKLKVTYSLNGDVDNIDIEENKVLKLPLESFKPVPFIASLSVTPEKTTLAVAENGQYTLTKSSGKKATIEVSDLPEPIKIKGDWQLKFTPGWNAPEEITLPKLTSWTTSDVNGIRYYSGTAAYYKQFDIPADFQSKSDKIILDLGQVLYLAQVKLNGKDLGTLWKYPFRLDITDALKTGSNDLEIAVTNLWVNRLIGDEQYPDDCQWNGNALKAWPDWLLKNEPRPVKERLTFTTWKHWKKDDPLLPSGLIGPVKINAVRIITVTN